MTSELNFTTKNNGANVFIDIGNQLIKIGYLNVRNEWVINRLKTRSSTIEDFDNIFKKLHINKIYLGSVVLQIKRFLIDYFDNNNIQYEIIYNELFRDELKLAQNIDLSEVGTDILGFAYLIKGYANTLAINFGTATVAIYYNNQICGVSIGIDFFNSYKNLLDTINLPLKLGTYKKFGANTKDAFDSSRYFLINGFINEMLKTEPSINKIIYTGGNRGIFSAYENISSLEIIEIDEAVLKGYRELICKIKSIK